MVVTKIAEVMITELMLALTVLLHKKKLTEKDVNKLIKAVWKFNFQTAFPFKPTLRQLCCLSAQAVRFVLSSRILSAGRLFPHPSVWWF